MEYKEQWISAIDRDVLDGESHRRTSLRICTVGREYFAKIRLGAHTNFLYAEFRRLSQTSLRLYLQDWPRHQPRTSGISWNPRHYAILCQKS